MPGLRTNRAFTRVWASSMVGELGTAVSTLALPLAAVQVLDADALAVSILTAVPSVTYLLVSLPFGAYVDRHDRRRMMIGCDIGRAVITALIPLLWALGALSMHALWAIAFANGCLSVLFVLSYQSIVPSIVPKPDLVQANSRMSIPASISEVLGPGVGGALVGAIGAPLAIVLDSISYAVSAAFLGSIGGRRRDPQSGDGTIDPSVVPTHSSSGRSPRQIAADIGEGLAFVFGHTVLRRITYCLATTNFFVAMRTAVIIVFMVRVLDATPLQIGIVLGLGAVGGVVGALIGQRVIARYGQLRSLWKMKSSFGWVVLLVPLGMSGWGLAPTAVGLFASSLTAMIFSIAQMSYRQNLCPPEMLGRMNASIRWVIWGAMPFGAIIGGVIATAAEPRIALSVSAVGMVLSVFFVASSDFRHPQPIEAEVLR